jgi:UDP-N-acetylglucosamine acyltransferase
MATEIHPTAVVHDGAVLDEGASIGPFCIVGPKVKIGAGSQLQSHVVVEGRTEIGSGCTVYPFSYLGQPPQDVKYKGEDTAVKIGNNNQIREYVTIHRASVKGDGVTEVGDGNFLMAYVHIAHDCKLGSHIVIANYSGLSGHVELEDHVMVGGLTGIHQFVRVGKYAMVGGFTGVGSDVPPFMLSTGTGTGRAKLYGLNTVGLKRHGFSNEDVSELKQAYKILFRGNLGMSEAIKKVQEELPYTEHIAYLIEFIQKNKRGIIR